MKRQFLACVGLLAFLPIVPLRSDLLASECVRVGPPRLITSKIMIQVFDLDEHPIAGAHVELAVSDKKTGYDKETIGFGETDAQGFVEFVGATPGLYGVLVKVDGFRYHHEPIQLVRRGQAPPVMAVVQMRWVDGCNGSCPVSTSVPLKTMAMCLPKD